MNIIKNILINKNNKIIMALMALFFIFISNKSHATFMDQDTYCMNYGCVVVCDFNSCDAYDVYILPAGPTVPVGGMLIRNAGSPVLGTTAVFTTYRDTNIIIDSTLPLNAGTNISVINPLGAASPLNPVDAGSIGYLDAADTLVKFGVQATTRVDWRATAAPPAAVAGGTNPQKHNFYFGSRGVAIDVKARAVAVANSGQFPISVTPALIGFSTNYTLTGTDAGVLYGTNAQVPAGTYINGGITNIGSLIPGPTTVASFTLTTGTRINNDGGTNNLLRQLRQCIRFEMNYTLPALDFSQGDGVINYRIDYDFYRR